MKYREWNTFLDEQARRVGKVIFTVTELSHVAGTSPQALNVELDRLRKQGGIEQYARGVYGIPHQVTADDLVPYLDPMAYITAAFALFRHNIITQVPTTVTCFTNRRHNRSRLRTTSIGKFEFVCVSEPIYCPPPLTIAPPEQALCDCVYIMRRRGVDPESVFTFRNLDNISHTSVSEIVYRYPKTVQIHVQNRLGNDR